MKNNNKKQKKAGQAVVVKERREFYKDSYKALSKLAMVSVGCLVTSIGLTAYSLNAKHENVYIAASDSGQLVKLIPLSSPNMKDANVADWVAKALIDTFNFNFVDIKQSLNTSAQSWFTEEGGQALIKALTESGNFDAVINQKLIVTLNTEHTPVITRKFFNQRTRRYTWHLEVPALISYRTQSKEFSKRVLFKVAVSRISLREDPNGLGISKIIMENRK
ncbi:DotI/IcmL family type IV secretion protein [Vibrio owensii]|uniref:DotI/IcmL family type IV secretion protein n=1 Tax=Vibrio harveyi group TaxID=717610 RepID=UPI003CC6199D